MALFSIVTTCKGRLDDLKNTIGRMVEQSDCELIVVDYNCPQKTAEYVRKNYPTAKIVKDDSAADFNQSRARNMGAEVASGEILVFLDADVLISKSFITQLKNNLVPRLLGGFPIVNAKWRGLAGSCVVERKAWKEALGYDEVLRGYGGDDRDFYHRLSLLGCKKIKFPLDLIERIIETPVDKKVQYYDEKDMHISKAVNTAYRQLKNLLLLVSGKVEIDISTRKHVRELVSSGYYRAIKNGDRECSVVVEIPHDGTFAEIPGHKLSRLVGVKVKLS